MSDIPDMTKILLSIKEYYSNNQTNIGSVDNLELSFFADYPSLRPKEVESYSLLFERLKGTESSPEFVSTYLDRVRRTRVASELAIKALELSEGKGTLEDLETLFTSLREDSLILTNEDEFVTDDLHELLEQTYLVPGLRWRLNSLNKALGSLRKGDFGFIFKRPETGGTTFLASEVSFMAGQTDRPILWFNNEEQSKKVKVRCYQAALGCKLDDLHKSEVASLELYKTTTKGNIRIYPDSDFSSSDISRACVRHNPVLVVIDQLDKIKGFAEDRKDLEYGSIYRWARELAKRHCPVIGISQASASAEDKMWLSMDDIAESKTAKAAEADWILGIGKKHSKETTNVRYFNICKNKLLGDKDSWPELRHGQITTIIKPEIARYEDVEKF